MAEEFSHGCGRSHLIVVVDEIDFMGTTVGSTAAPVINHIVEHIMMTIIVAGAIESARDTPVASFVMCQQIVVERSGQSSHLSASDGSGIAVLCSRAVVGMVGTVERLADDSALQRDGLGITA